jgi:hypothetical protein
MAEKQHDHLITVDLQAQCIRVFRLEPNGEKVLFTEYSLPEAESAGWTEKVTELAHVLGEDLFMDSSALRKRYSL